MPRLSFARLSNSNWRSALGEIAIVVIGILIALGVDSCNDARIEANRETDYLTRLAADIRRDTAMFTFTDSLVEKKQQALAAAAVILRGESPLRDTVAFLRALTSGSNLGWNQPRVRPVTFQDLLSTGNLRLIGDLELRDALVRYYLFADGVNDRVRTRVTGYAPLTYELLPRRDEYTYDGPEHGPALRALTEQVLASELGRLLTAEQNFARFVRTQNALLREAAEELLSEMQQAGFQPPRDGG